MKNYKDLNEEIVIRKGMGGFEFICLCIFLAGMLFYLDIYLSDKYQDKIKQEDFPIITHTNKDKSILCTGWSTCMKMAEAIVYESRGESVEGRRMVGWVIMNRVEHPHWPDTVEAVIEEPYQFSYLRDKHRQKTPTKKDWEEAQAISYNVLNGLVKDNSNGATFYFEKSIKPKWAAHKQFVTQIDNHKFYKGNR